MNQQNIVDQALDLLDPQNRRLIKVHSPLPSSYGLQLDAFEGEERFSQPYRFNLKLLAYNARIPLKELCGQPFQLEIETPQGEPRFISGYSTHATSQGADEGLAVYAVTLSPWLYWLSQRTNSRIFQDLAADAIIERIFGEYGALARYEFRLREPLPTLSYCVQYRESDLQFVQRLIERHGLMYFFEQTAEGHRLFITDTSLSLPQLEQQPSIRFHRAQVNETEDSITSWGGTRAMQPTQVSLKTFDYKQPRLDSRLSLRSITDQGGDDGGLLEVYDFPGAYGYRGWSEGERLARQHLEMLEMKAKTFTGESNVRALKLGRWFTLEGHYDHERDSPDDRQFLVISIAHAGRNNYRQGANENATYHNSFSCIRNTIPYRSPYETPAPVIAGPQTATVVGPEGEEVFTDDMYRIKVQFHWDREASGDDRSSCWVRVASPGAGAGHGFVRVPRVGEEVVVEFLEGDPDRPLVTGTLYNGANGVPWSLPDQRNVSGFMSRSTRGGSAANASWLQFDDTLGGERVHLHAERTLTISVEADEHHQVDGSEYEDIKNDKSVQLGEGNYTLDVAQGKVTIVAAQEISLQAGASRITMTEDGAIQVDAVSFRVNASSIDLA